MFLGSDQVPSCVTVLYHCSHVPIAPPAVYFHASCWSIVTSHNYKLHVKGVLVKLQGNTLTSLIPITARELLVGPIFAVYTSTHHYACVCKWPRQLHKYMYLALRIKCVPDTNSAFSSPLLLDLEASLRTSRAHATIRKPILCSLKNHIVDV